MLEEFEIPFRYREYTQEPLSVDEVRMVLTALGLRPADVLRRRDPAFGELGIDGSETDEVLIRALVAHPTLLERPIGVMGSRAVIGRPPERLVALWRSEAQQL